MTAAVTVPHIIVNQCAVFSEFSKPQPELNFNPFVIVLLVHEATRPHQHPQHADQLKSAYPTEIKEPGHCVLFITPPLEHNNFLSILFLKPDAEPIHRSQVPVFAGWSTNKSFSLA